MGKYEDNTREYFNKIADNYDSRFDGRIAAAFYDAVSKKLDSPGCHSVLDVGCGTGSMLLRASDVGRDLALCGIDISPEMTRIAKSRLGDKADIGVCDICSNQLRYDDASFDCVLCMTAFHHFSKPRRALGEIRRVIKPEGRLIIADVTAVFPIRQLDNLVFYVSGFLPLHRDGDYRLYSRAGLCRLLERCGFVTVRWEAVAGPSRLVRLFLVTATPLK